MTQLCTKRRSLLVPVCIFRDKSVPQNAPARRQKQGTFFRWISPRSRCNLSPVMKSTLLLLALLTAVPSLLAQGVVAPGATLQKLAGDFKFTEGPTCDKAGN